MNYLININENLYEIYKNNLNDFDKSTYSDEILKQIDIIYNFNLNDKCKIDYFEDYINLQNCIKNENIKYNREKTINILYEFYNLNNNISKYLFNIHNSIKNYNLDINHNQNNNIFEDNKIKYLKSKKIYYELKEIFDSQINDLNNIYNDIFNEKIKFAIAL